MKQTKKVKKLLAIVWIPTKNLWANIFLTLILNTPTTVDCLNQIDLSVWHSGEPSSRNRETKTYNMPLTLNNNKSAGWGQRLDIII